jgi:hypothetical protein
VEAMLRTQTAFKIPQSLQEKFCDENLYASADFYQPSKFHECNGFIDDAGKAAAVNLCRRRGFHPYIIPFKLSAR